MHLAVTAAAINFTGFELWQRSRRAPCKLDLSIAHVYCLHWVLYNLVPYSGYIWAIEAHTRIGDFQFDDHLHGNWSHKLWSAPKYNWWYLIWRLRQRQLTYTAILQCIHNYSIQNNTSSKMLKSQKRILYSAAVPRICTHIIISSATMAEQPR